MFESRDLQGNLYWQRRLEGIGGRIQFTSVCMTDEGEIALLGYAITEKSPGVSSAIFLVADPEGLVARGTDPSRIPFQVRVLEDRTSD